MLCVLKPEEGVKLVQSVPGAQCLIVPAEGTAVRSDGFKRYEVVKSAVAATQGAQWPEGFQVGVTVQVKPMPRKKKLRPYLALWVEDAKGNHIRTLEVWSNPREMKYLKDMTSWWKIGKTDPNLVKMVTRATRPAGKYTFTWDGTDQGGNPVARGTYNICLEVAYEEGEHNVRQGTIVSDDKPATGTIKAAPAFEEVQLLFGPSEK